MDAAIRVFKRVYGLSEGDGESGPAGVAYVSVRLLVASTQAINLIGKQGSLIKSIQESTGASARVLSGGNDASSLSLITVLGKFHTVLFWGPLMWGTKVTGAVLNSIGIGGQSTGGVANGTQSSSTLSQNGNYIEPIAVTFLLNMATCFRAKFVQAGYQTNSSSMSGGEQTHAELPSNRQGLQTVEALIAVLHRAERLLSGHAIVALSVINLSLRNIEIFPPNDLSMSLMCAIFGSKDLLLCFL
ncbi:hypothetical protein K1719_005715 [Acacia pycnantha]|nr:hypothetical protein K1719_005715 [Acacia pycnantha]